MGVLDPDQTTFGDIFAGQQPPALPGAEERPQTLAGSGLQDSLTAYRQQQQDALAEHRDYGERLQRTADATQQRGTDLHLVERMYTILDDRVPKNTKAFLYREMARSMGLDAKGGTVAEVGQMLTGMDPASAGTLRAMINQQMQGAEPGALQGLFKGIMTGAVPMHEVTKMAGAVSAQQQQQQAAAATAGVRRPELPGMMRLGGPTEETQVAQASDLPLPAQREQEKPYNQRQADPGLIGRLGPDFDPGSDYTNADLRARGFTRIDGSNPKQVEAATKVLDKTERDTSILLKQFRDIDALIQGRPEVLGPAGTVTRTIDQIMEGGKALGRQLGVDFRIDLNTPDANEAINRVTYGLVRSLQVKGVAVDAAVVRSRIVESGYTIAAALYGQEGRALTNQDFIQALQTLGANQSPEQMQAVLKSISERVYDRRLNDTRTATGKALDLDLRDYSPQELEQTKQAGTTPPKLVAAVDKELNRRMAEEDARRADAQGGQQQTQQQGSRDQRRASPTVEEQQAAELRRRRQEAEDTELIRQGRKQTMDIQQQANERAKRGEERADRAEVRAERREEREIQKENRQMIQRAFEMLAKAIGDPAVPQVGRSGGGGQDQDARAFQLPARPQRQAPRPGAGGGR